MAMRPAEGTHLFFVGAAGVLFHEPAQKLFQLNTVATFVWCQLQDRREPACIQSRLQETFSLPEAEAARYLAQTHGLLASIGVLRGFESAPAAMPAEEPAQVPANVRDGAAFVSEGRYRLLESRIRMRFTHDDHRALVDPVLGHLRDDGAGPPTVEFDVIQAPGGRIHLCRDGRSLLCCEARNQIAPLAKSLVWQAALHVHDYFLNIHAAVVGDGRRCFLLPAAPGSGKSTLAAALIQQGFEYFSDEVALLHERGLQVEAVPLALCIKAPGVAALSRRYPGLAALDVHLRSDGKRVRYLPPPAHAVPPPETRRPVAAIVFPRYRPEQATTLEPMDSAQALQWLLRECLVVDARLTLDRVAGLLAWIEQTPCYRLVVSDLDTAVALMKALAHEQGDRGDAEPITAAAVR